MADTTKTKNKNKKPHINRTCRVRFASPLNAMTTIYTSSHVIGELRPNVIMLKNNIFVPRKGYGKWVVEQLWHAINTEKYYDHFTQPGRDVIGVYARDHNIETATIA